MGVNEFLHGLVNSEGKLYFPEFVVNNFWKHKFLEWKSGIFTDEEIEIFGFNKTNLPKIDVHPDLIDYTGDNLESVTTDEQKLLKEKIELKWSHQAMYGDVIHYIGQLLFTKIKTGPDTGKLWIDMLSTKKDLFLKQIDGNAFDIRLRPIRKKITDKQIDQIIDHFIRLKKQLEETLGEGLIFLPEVATVGTVQDNSKNI
jgi:hypothetical protein